MKQRKHRIRYMFILWLENDSFDKIIRRPWSFREVFSNIHRKAI